MSLDLPAADSPPKECFPLPDKRTRLNYKRSFSASEFELIRRGVSPRDMDDRWHIYFSDSYLYFYRSWTGLCIFRLKIDSNGQVLEALANRDESQHNASGDQQDEVMLASLIDNLLLGKTGAWLGQHFEGGSASFGEVKSGQVSSKKRSAFLGCLVGLACGDALGVTTEFKERGTFTPVKDMLGGGPWSLTPGQWTDDTSMAICLAESLVACNGFDASDQMRRYSKWASEGYRSSNGRCFDIGQTVSNALVEFNKTGKPFCGSKNPRSAGNGCLMRLAPVPMYFSNNMKKSLYYSEESSRTTHGAKECIDACKLFGGMLVKALCGSMKDEVLFGKWSKDAFRGRISPGLESIRLGDYREKSEESIKGSGYVVSSLEAALWCFHHSGSFEEAVLKAVNLGDDADTTASICGQLAGAFYGFEAIPHQWITKLTALEYITWHAEEIFKRSSTIKPETSFWKWLKKV